MVRGITKLLVRVPSSRLAEGLVTHIVRSSAVDVVLARVQHSAYVKAIVENSPVSLKVVYAAEKDDCPDGVFVEDVLISITGTFSILTSPGALERKPEVASMQQLFTKNDQIGRITLPSLDGGDVLQCPATNTIFVGQSARTTLNGIRQLSALVAPHNKRVVAVPVSKVLHLKSAVTALPSGELVAWKAGLDQASIEALGEGGKRLITFMPEEAGAHVVALDDKTLLMSSAAPRSISALENRGFRVVPVDITEYEKLEGCVTCLSVRIRE